ncbi:MAG TPA: EamA family transporter [Ilumatobacter sp.]|nr:EamA family transporter [Ilumatobacter sp.]
MEDIWRWRLVTAIAPIAWGSSYYVTHRYLPAGSPLYGAAIRAVPAGLLLLAVARRLPRGVWWRRSLVLGTLNMGAFFALVYVAAQRLPTSIAATVMATSPVAMMLIAWLLIGERPRATALAGATLGVGGVTLLLSTGGDVDPVGVAASIAAMVMSSAGYVLAKRWSGEVDVLASTAWQLLAGGLTLVPLALVVEGAPPELDRRAVLAFVYVSVVATAVAFVAWFSGLRRLRAGDVGLIGLLNPVTGALLGTVVAAEVLNARQLAGLVFVLAGVVVGSRTRRGAGERPGRVDAGPPATSLQAKQRAAPAISTVASTGADRRGRFAAAIVPVIHDKTSRDYMTIEGTLPGRPDRPPHCAPRA